ncbi:hypothetical protein H1P_2310008 [Hyella patelloides LEGE 07179]|uniref:Uncharacterized protein n=1 Tax=Hyella patelloides LEGE 07179 TaxID=945734 RepID=A0A563VRL2_9CYAN|nr:hypothetical protein H1P_2310008 [Hyella patelloides LEGE 07179]
MSLTALQTTEPALTDGKKLQKSNLSFRTKNHLFIHSIKS